MIYDEEMVLEIAKEMGIDIIPKNGYSRLQGVEISLDDIGRLFNNTEDINYDSILLMWNKSDDTIRSTFSSVQATKGPLKENNIKEP